MRYITLFFLLSFVINFQAQTFKAGIQGGVNYNFSRDLTELNILEIPTDDVLHKAKSIEGYHGGVWGMVSFSGLFIKTELLYTKFENNFATEPTTSMVTKKIDIPVVLGMEILGPIYAFAGPDFQYIISEKFSVSNTTTNYDNFTTGLHLGLGIELGKLAFDIRWDKGLSQNTLDIINSELVNENFTLDNRPNQIVLSLHYSLTSSDN